LGVIKSSPLKLW